MNEYVMELYMRGKDADERVFAAALAHEGAERVTDEGLPVRYLGSIFIPSDETCLHLFDAHSLEAVREASERASIRFERIVASVRLDLADLRRTERHFGGPERQ